MDGGWGGLLRSSQDSGILRNSQRTAGIPELSGPSSHLPVAPTCKGAHVDNGHEAFLDPHQPGGVSDARKSPLRSGRAVGICLAFPIKRKMEHS